MHVVVHAGLPVDKQLCSAWVGNASSYVCVCVLACIKLCISATHAGNMSSSNRQNFNKSRWTSHAQLHTAAAGPVWRVGRVV